MQQTYRYKAFISYSHRDEKWAAWLHRAIETYRVPKYLVGQQTPMGQIPARTSPVFRDRDELASATDLGVQLREALEGSGCLLVICSPASAASHWVNEEILAFKRLGRADRIFALIVGGEPYASGMSGREAEECFPPALRYLLGPDGELSTTPAEPIAADAREGKDGKSNAQMKLLAGMLGVGFDALRQRELQRRQRRLAIIAGGSMAGMVVAIALATSAVLARNEAERQRARAEKETETARKVSSFMTGLFKVADPSEARGKSITAREILMAGGQRIDTELQGEPAVQAELMETIGSVYAGLGLYDDATDMLTRSLAKRSAFDPVDPGQVARSQVQLANVLTAKAKLKRAEKLYLQAISALDAKGAEQPAAPRETLEELSVALAGLAEVYYQAGRYTDAEPILRRVLDIRRRYLPPVDSAVADAMEELGLNQWDQGNLERSEQLMRESLTLRRKALGEAPHPDLASHLNNLALLLMDLQQFTESERLFREAMQMNNALYGESHPDIATGLNNLGLLYRTAGKLDKAEENYRRALEMQRKLLGDEHPTVARSLNNLAFVLYDEGEVDDAIETQRQALAIRRKSLGDKHVDTANSMAALARWIASRGPSDEAVPMAREALALQIELQGEENEETAKAEIGLAHALKWQPESRPEALKLARHGIALLKKLLGDSDWLIAYAVSTEGSVLASMGRYDEAERLLKSAYETLAGESGAGSAYVRLAREELIALYEQRGQPELALDLRNAAKARATP